MIVGKSTEGFNQSTNWIADTKTCHLGFDHESMVCSRQALHSASMYQNQLITDEETDWVQLPDAYNCGKAHFVFSLFEQNV